MSNPLKRLFDILASFLGLLLLAPFFGLLAWAIKRDSPGPVFYRGKRPGCRETISGIIATESADERRLMMIAVSPRLGEFLTKATQTSDLETAFWRVFNEYVEMKMAALRETMTGYERKWGMTFDEFAQQCRDGKLKESAYSWEVEQDYWGWEQAITLLRHYGNLSLAA